MSIAIYIKSESCDSYLYSYDTGTSEEKIKDDLESDLDMFRPISDYTVQISDSESPSTETRVEIIMAEIFKKSWERDDDKKVKELSAGIIFMTEDKELFMGRVTGSHKPGMPAHKWDIPKGHVEADESPIEAAIRETEEETGFTQYDPAFLKDLGEFRYSDNKNLHLFLYTVPVEHEQFRHSKCSAYHTFPDGSTVPEFDAFALIKPSQWQYVMGKSMYKVMTQIFG